MISKQYEVPLDEACVPDGAFSNPAMVYYWARLAVSPSLLAPSALAAEDACNRRTCQMRQPPIHPVDQSGGLLGPASRPAGTPLCRRVC
jgi:hypothetical protein